MRLWKKAIKGCVIEVAALDYRVSSTETSEKEPECPQTCLYE